MGFGPLIQRPKCRLCLSVEWEGQTVGSITRWAITELPCYCRKEKNKIKEETRENSAAGCVRLSRGELNWADSWGPIVMYQSGWHRCHVSWQAAINTASDELFLILIFLIIAVFCTVIVVVVIKCTMAGYPYLSTSFLSGSIHHTTSHQYAATASADKTRASQLHTANPTPSTRSCILLRPGQDAPKLHGFKSKARNKLNQRPVPADASIPKRSSRRRRQIR